MMKYFNPIIFDKDTKRIFYKSMLFLGISKSLALASPYCIKIAVDALAEASKMDFNLACLALIGFGAARIFSSVF